MRACDVEKSASRDTFFFLSCWSMRFWVERLLAATAVEVAGRCLVGESASSMNFWNSSMSIEAPFFLFLPLLFLDLGSACS